MAFSLGVEIGHQIAILPAFGCLCLLRWASRDKSHHDRRIRRYGSAVISLLGMMYVVVALR
jgi:hypothetical protein